MVAWGHSRLQTHPPGRSVLIVDGMHEEVALWTSIALERKDTGVVLNVYFQFELLCAVTLTSIALERKDTGVVQNVYFQFELLCAVTL